jgi:hypothetical protein
MNATLRDAMHAAVSDATPSHDLLTDVLAGGRRRLRRRRSATAVGVSMSLVLCGLAVAGLRMPKAPPPVPALAGPLGDGGAHGDLADDASYAASVRSALRDWLAQAKPSSGRPIGSGEVLWAGSTPAGPAAVIQQTVDFHKHKQTAVWFIGVGPDGPRVTSSNLVTPHVAAWYVDVAHRVLAVVDNGTPRGISYRWTYTPDGQARRHFQSLPFEDGVAVVTLPADVPRANVQVSNLPYTSFNSLVGIGNVELTDVPDPNRRLVWNDPTAKTATMIPLAHGNGQAQIGPARDALAVQLDTQAGKLLEANTDQAGNASNQLTWFIYGATPTGHQVVVFQRQLDGDPARLYLLVDDVLADAGAVDPAAALPVRIHLRNGEGWVVAQYGSTLRYRVGAGPWIAVGPNAGLLPEAATAVAVTAPGGHQDVVSLRSG